MAEAAQRAFIDGLNEILIVAALVAFAGGVLGFALVRVARLRRAPEAAAAEPCSRPASSMRRPWQNAALTKKGPF